ncbi:MULTISPECIES: multidrug transporter subunit MdtN [unclassified Undibacterium]|uniref:multidrug transporter subunit MdtN n=1 Tax=unclassified Undibacterium TaxID=2630295 RepID=UPI002AC9813A|nr:MULTISPECIES: multidrug transporter subunit MdtN [unclassified Undibacterium]MEB0137729.1 multidrug transporter subunit MdtN [Undibacterium sp. CCC2.1]MEB0172829.1 multidrug transporter subunit MdtN [Undibacterium sp. CCC1.1]MEB0176697.1 multidrug transporter subunit MdtN [Undibacterium sp. CCC3.4]MEB0215977.1 multidrug transporter subunit MdtN [Undibacterium sp. 5I2]WPX42304.1 multidrug transporter subunit MdtN [Undibacterium sp. CCC3.4]
MFASWSIALRRSMLLLALCVAAALLILVVWRLDTAPRTDDAYVAVDVVHVAAEVSGRLVDLPIKDNQAVRVGEVLFRLDARPYELAVSRAAANLQALESDIMLAQRAVTAQKFAAAAARAGVVRADVTARQSAATLARVEPLLAQGYVAAEQVDQAQTTRLTSQAQLLTAELEAQRANAAVSGIEALVARRAVLQAEWEQAKLKLAYTTVRAPFDGRVIGLKISTGEMVDAGHAVFTLLDTRHWYVIANFRETELAHITPGRATQVYLLSDSTKAYQGVVESVGYGVYPEEGGAETAGLPRVPRAINWVRVAQRFPVRILVQNPDPQQFRLGLSAVAVLKAQP